MSISDFFKAPGAGGIVSGVVSGSSITTTGTGYPVDYSQIYRAMEDEKLAFEVVKIENGFLVLQGGKKYFAEKITDVADRVVAVMVEKRLEK